MNLLIETLNAWADHALRFAWPMLWQSSLLIGLLFALDLLMRRKLRPALRYALWLVVLVKLVLPPSLAVPTSAGWWLRPARTVLTEPRRTTVVVTYGPTDSPVFPVAATPVFVTAARPRLTLAALAFVCVVAVGLGLLAWMLRRWHQVARDARRATAAPLWLDELLGEPRWSVQPRDSHSAGVRVREPQRREERREKSRGEGAQTNHLSGADLQVSETGLSLRSSRLCGLMERSSTARLRFRLTDHPQSPAVCGLFRPVILLPRSLVEHLPPAQLRAVLLHELLHLRRGDVWVNCAQALLQIAYWWHPLLWLANARIRRVREEAVDDAVMLALDEDAEAYAPTLLEVAKMALHRPLATLGLIGILEPRSSLRQRIERLVDFRPPRRAGLTLGSALAVFGFAALALPMGEAPATTEAPQSAGSQVATISSASDASPSPGSLNQDTEKSHETNPFYIRVFKVDTNTLVEGLHLAMDTFETNGSTATALRDYFMKAGADLDPTKNPGKSIFYDHRQTALMVRGTKQDLDIIEREIAALGVLMEEIPDVRAVPPLAASDAATNNSPPQDSANGAFLQRRINTSKLVRDGKLLYEMGKLDEAEAKLKLVLKDDPHNAAALYYLDLVAQARAQMTGGLRKVLPSPRRELLPVPDPHSRTNLVRTSQGRQAIVTKLANIRLDRVEYDHQQLGWVVVNLDAEARKHDPEHVGINFILDTVTPGHAQYLASLPITIKPPLINIRLADVLDAVVKLTKQPIQYSILDEGVLFSAKRGEGPPPLYIQTFKIDPATLRDGLRAAMGPFKTDISQTMRDYLARGGVNLDPYTNPEKAVFYNDRQGMLLVRATLQDLDIIEQQIAVLNTAPPQVNIKVKFVEVSQDDTKASGFDWYLGTVSMTSGTIGGQAGTAPSNTVSPVAKSPVGAFPGNPLGPAPTTIASSPTNQLAHSGFRNSSAPPPTLTGILTEPQFRVVMNALQQRSGADLLAQPEVTTSSGRQAQMKTVTIQGVVKGINERALMPPGITTTNEDESALYVTEPMEFGPMLDVIPSVLADGYTIALTVMPTATEFLGYETGQTNRVAVYVNGKKKWVIPPRPIVRRQQMSTSVRVWDGQTLVLGGLPSETVNTLKDKVPMLGDLPLVGPLFRKESKNTQKRILLVFITPTIIDPAGNRVHTADQTPATHEAIPPQPAH
ncbi:MAG: M56 family metallopeptidase [Limisphaerales bacterium]